MFLGEDLLGWLLLALGASMMVGNGLALIRPPEKLDEGNLEKAPLWRSVLYISLGLIATMAALGTLLGS